MKTILKVVIMTLVIGSLFSFTAPTNLQDKVTVTAVYDGLEDYGYNFIVTKNGVENTITFQEIDETILKTYDLTSQEFVGKSFKVTYNALTETMEDEFGNEEETEFLTIVSLVKL